MRSAARCSRRRAILESLSLARGLAGRELAVHARRPQAVLELLEARAAGVRAVVHEGVVAESPQEAHAVRVGEPGNRLVGLRLEEARESGPDLASEREGHQAPLQVDELADQVGRVEDGRELQGAAGDPDPARRPVELPVSAPPLLHQVVASGQVARLEGMDLDAVEGLELGHLTTNRPQAAAAQIFVVARREEVLAAAGA